MKEGLIGMSIVANIVVILTALEFVFIFYLETIATTSKRTASVFNMEQDELCFRLSDAIRQYSFCFQYGTG